MPPFLAELLGTMLLIILGDGVVANVVVPTPEYVRVASSYGFAPDLSRQ